MHRIQVQKSYKIWGYFWSIDHAIDTKSHNTFLLVQVHHSLLCCLYSSRPYPQPLERWSQSSLQLSRRSVVVAAERPRLLSPRSEWLQNLRRRSSKTVPERWLPCRFWFGRLCTPQGDRAGSSPVPLSGDRVPGTGGRGEFGQGYDPSGVQYPGRCGQEDWFGVRRECAQLWHLDG